MLKGWRHAEREFGTDVVALLDRNIGSHHALDMYSSEGVLWLALNALYDNGYTIVKKEE